MSTCLAAFSKRRTKPKEVSGCNCKTPFIFGQWRSLLQEDLNFPERPSVESSAALPGLAGVFLSLWVVGRAVGVSGVVCAAVLLGTAVVPEGEVVTVGISFFPSVTGASSEIPFATLATSTMSDPRRKSTMAKAPEVASEYSVFHQVLTRRLEEWAWKRRLFSFLQLWKRTIIRSLRII